MARFIKEKCHEGRRCLRVMGIALLQLLCVQSGLLHSDFVTTVSPTYAKEVLTPEVRNESSARN